MFDELDRLRSNPRLLELLPITPTRGPETVKPGRIA